MISRGAQIVPIETVCTKDFVLDKEGVSICVLGEILGNSNITAQTTTTTYFFIKDQTNIYRNDYDYGKCNKSVQK